MSAPNQTEARTFRFGVFEVDLATRELRKRGRQVRLQEQPFRVLEALLEKPGEIVTREELKERLWAQDEFVEFDKSLNTAVQKIRQALGDSAESPRFLETMPKVGYRFVAPIAPPGLPVAPETVEAPAPPRPRPLPWVIAAALALACLWLAHDKLAEPPLDRPVRHYNIAPEAAGAGLLAGDRVRSVMLRGTAVVSPDGSRIAYWSDENPTRLWIYRLDRGEARPLEGTEGGSRHFWSPDSRVLGFFADGAVRRISSEGGAVVALCTLPPTYEDFTGGSWSPNGESVVMSFRSGGGAHLFSVPSSGGKPEQMLAERADLFRPYYLPSATPALLVNRLSAAYVFAPQVVNLSTGELAPVWSSGSQVTYSPSGHVLFLQGNVLWAAPFSTENLERTGEPFVVAGNMGPPSVSMDGTLVAPRPSGSVPMLRQLTLRGRDGALLGTIGPPLYSASNPRASPDGKRVAISASDREGASKDIWLLDVGRSGGRRLVTDRLVADQPAWTPDGRELLFEKQNDTDRNADFFLLDVATGTPPQPFLISEYRESEPDWSPDGATLVYQRVPPGEFEFDLYYVVRSEDGELGDPVPFLETEFNEVHPIFSPDGGFVAYASSESGLTQIYLRPFPEGTPVWQVSQRGGASPRWSRDGKELYWIGRDETGARGRTVWAARMDLDGSTPVGEIRVLFESELVPTGSFMYDVLPDGRFVVVEPAASERESRERQYIRVIENWAQIEGAQEED